MTRTLLALLFLLAAGAGEAHAIPAFARAYQVPCSTCHDAITRRNDFGDAFRKAGYRWPGGPAIDAEARKPLVMPGYSAMRTLLPAQVPLALSATFSAAYTDDPDLDEGITLGSPALNILLGGALGDHVGFFGTWSGRGSPGELYLHVARLLCRPELNLRFGLFEQSTTLFKANEALIAPFALGTSALNGHVVSQGRLGGEINGIVRRRTFWAAGVVQNGGPDSNLDLYYHVSHRLGGRSFSGEARRVDPEEASFLDRVHLTIAHWAYMGRVNGPSGERLARVRRWAGEAKLGAGRFGLWGGVMVGFDRDLTVYVDSRNVTWFAEVSYAIRPWLRPMYLYQYQDSAGFPRELQVHDLGVVLLPLENLRVRVKLGIADDSTANEAAELQVFFGF